MSERDSKGSSLTAVGRARLELEVAEGELAFSASRFREDLRALTDYRRPLRKRPWLYCGLAFAAGLFLATALRRKGSP
jgi:hypothetical protein